MLTAAFIAICLSGTPVTQCNRETAVDWIAAPETSVGLAGCQLHGLQYAASSRLVKEGTYPKVFCRPVQIPEGLS